jgi:hypothetical protein
MVTPGQNWFICSTIMSTAGDRLRQRRWGCCCFRRMVISDRLSLSHSHQHTLHPSLHTSYILSLLLRRRTRHCFLFDNRGHTRAKPVHTRDTQEKLANHNQRLLGVVARLSLLQKRLSHPKQQWHLVQQVVVVTQVVNRLSAPERRSTASPAAQTNSSAIALVPVLLARFVVRQARALVMSACASNKPTCPRASADVTGTTRYCYSDDRALPATNDVISSP